MNINWQVMILMSLIIFVSFMAGYAIGLVRGFRQAATGQAKLIAALFAGLKVIEGEEKGVEKE